MFMPQNCYTSSPRVPPKQKKLKSNVQEVSKHINISNMKHKVMYTFIKKYSHFCQPKYFKLLHRYSLRFIVLEM